MNASAIRDTVKQTVSRIIGIRVDQIDDHASFVRDLGLDSLALLEIAVDAEMAFRVKIPEERLPEIQTVEDAVRVVGECLVTAVEV